MAGAEVLRHGRSVSRFIKGALTESDREGPYGRADWACIRATTVELSIPPNRNSPTGTSATMRSATAALKQIASLGDELLVIRSGQRCAARRARHRPTTTSSARVL